MPALVRRSDGGGVVVVVALVVSAGYALGAAATTPFSLAANIVTGLAIAIVTVLAIVLWPARPERAGVLVPDAEGSRPRHPYAAWVVLLAVVVGWELVEYLLRGSRSAHPTLSSMIDALDAHYLAKALVFFAWLWLGVAIVWAGTPVSSRFRAPRAEASPS